MVGYDVDEVTHQAIELFHKRLNRRSEFSKKLKAKRSMIYNFSDNNITDGELDFWVQLNDFDGNTMTAGELDSVLTTHTNSWGSSW